MSYFYGSKFPKYHPNGQSYWAQEPRDDETILVESGRGPIEAGSPCQHLRYENALCEPKLHLLILMIFEYFKLRLTNLVGILQHVWHIIH